MNALSNRNFYLINALVTTGLLTFLLWLIYFRETPGQSNPTVLILPAINAGLNSLCVLLLLAAFLAIKQRREKLHERLMISAFCVSAMFLISYVYYHSIQGDTKFLGEGWIRPFYFIILVSHILLSMAMVPMILSTIFFGLKDLRVKHRRIAKFTLPIWLYVSITGVIIFIMLRTFS